MSVKAIIETIEAQFTGANPMKHAIGPLKKFQQGATLTSEEKAKITPTLDLFQKMFRGTIGKASETPLDKLAAAAREELGLPAFSDK